MDCDVARLSHIETYYRPQFGHPQGDNESFTPMRSKWQPMRLHKWINVRPTHHCWVSSRLRAAAVDVEQKHHLEHFRKASGGCEQRHVRVRTQKNAYRPPNKDHTKEPNDTGITERIPWGPGAISPGWGFPKGRNRPLWACAAAELLVRTRIPAYSASDALAKETHQHVLNVYNPPDVRCFSIGMLFRRLLI